MKNLKSSCFYFMTGVIIFCSGVWNVHAQSSSPSESDYYSIDPMPVPEGIILEAGGLAFDENGDLMVPTRRGEVWRISNPGSNDPSFNRFAQGFHEPLGINYRNHAWYITQRGDLTKIEDRNNDGKADWFKTIYRWPLTGNYHEYSYGPEFLPNGEMLVTLNLSWIGQGASLTKWRGWMLQISEDGEITPYATGLRSPIGFGFNAEGDIFYTENQGDWIGSGWMTHLERGDFAGNPEGLKWTHLEGSPLDLTFEEVNRLDDSSERPLFEYKEQIPELKPPAVWFPHTIQGISTSDFVVIENDNQVGPFAGQLLVGDQGHSKILRVYQEKVKGEYQGVSFGFREGFSSGVIKLAWGPDNQTLYTGMTNRGWSSTGQAPFGIDRMRWNGQIPFEMKMIQAESNGFTLTFTKPVDFESAANINNYQVTDFIYIYHRKYGSPVINRQDKTITRVDVSEDRQSVRLYVDGLREGYINEVRSGVESNEGNTLLHPVGYYTLNNLPDGNRSAMVTGGDTDGSSGSGSDEASETSKRVTDMPADWSQGPDQTLQLGTQPGLRFDREEMTVEAGSKIALTFSNEDDMLHNVVIVEPGAADPVGSQAMQLGLEGDALGYVPQMEEVLFHTSLLEPNESETIYFQVPDTPGDYQFVCTFPGHHITMRGILRVI
ncbi:MAG: plastocyanin/azurin family copper-binding protein [Balneolaceae bacterium]